jgi:clan AA aspartic protease (TIGR02281 family)
LLASGAVFAVALVALRFSAALEGAPVEPLSAAPSAVATATAIATATTTAPVPAPTRAQPSGPSSSSGPGVTLVRDADSHFRALVSVNGQQFPMLVDSGASLIALTQADARRAGINPPPSAYTAIALTAGGEVRTAPVTIARISIGGIERRNVPAAVMPASALDQSLLGQSFLTTLTEVQIRGDRMALR